MMLCKNYDCEERVLVFVVLDGLKLALRDTEVMSVHLFFLFVLLLNGIVNIVWLCI